MSTASAENSTVGVVDAAPSTSTLSSRRMAPPASTWEFTPTRISRTRPAYGALTGVSIFIDSRITIVSPAATSVPAAARTATTTAGAGERTMPPSSRLTRWLTLSTSTRWPAGPWLATMWCRRSPMVNRLSNAESRSSSTSATVPLTSIRYRRGLICATFRAYVWPWYPSSTSRPTSWLARGGRPRANHAVGREVELGYQGQTYALNVAQISPRRYRIEVNDTVIEVELERLSEFESRLTIGDRRHHIVANQGPAGHLVEVDSVSHRVSRDEGGMVRSPAPAVVVAVRAAAGTEVAAGDTIVILESMKMETPVKAPYAGRVREILVGVNSQVDAGGAILRLDKVEEEGAASTTPTVEFSADAVDIGPDARAQILADVGTLRGLIMGFDVSTARARAVLTSKPMISPRSVPTSARICALASGPMSTASAENSTVGVVDAAPSSSTLSSRRMAPPASTWEFTPPRISRARPSYGALTGISIFIDSRITIVSPAGSGRSWSG